VAIVSCPVPVVQNQFADVLLEDMWQNKRRATKIAELGLTVEEVRYPIPTD
jgi:HrpA-like RNA helicase